MRQLDSSIGAFQLRDEMRQLKQRVGRIFSQILQLVPRVS
jgi:hypothetical protein